LGKELKVVPLVCPGCGNTMSGLRYDRVFICMRCKQGNQLDIKSADWVAHPLKFAAQENHADIANLFLPVWEIKVEVSAAPSNRAQEVSLRRLEDVDSVFVLAFNMIRPSYYGDIGLFYTEKGVTLTETSQPPKSSFVVGCTRTFEDAFNYARLFVTLMLDKKADVTGMDIDVRTKDSTLWAVPFTESGNHVIDLITGTKIPAFAVDDLDDIKRIAKRR
jgi:hypothetical protein